MLELPRYPVIAIAIVFGAVLILAAACGGGKDGSDQPTATTAASQTPADNGDGATTRVTLNDWSITGEGGGALSAQAGQVAFEIQNVGTVPHDFVVIATDIDVADLPVDAALVDEGAAGVVNGRASPIDAGNNDVLRLELEAGTYAVICNIAGHYAMGMYTSLTVE
jgi:uncharacterized cupredoxin-like copper-binding protein